MKCTRKRRGPEIEGAAIGDDHSIKLVSLPANESSTSVKEFPLEGVEEAPYSFVRNPASEDGNVYTTVMSV